MNWTAIGAVATGITGLIILVSVIVLSIQLSHQKKAMWSQTFLGLVDRLQDEELRKDRGIVFEAAEKQVDEWTDEEVAAAERVCYNYDLVGIMVRHKLLPTETIVDSWEDSLRRLWPICEPLVYKYRIIRGAPEFWDDFQWLAEEARKFDVKRGNRLRKEQLIASQRQVATSKKKREKAEKSAEDKD